MGVGEGVERREGRKGERECTERQSKKRNRETRGARKERCGVRKGKERI